MMTIRCLFLLTACGLLPMTACAEKSEWTNLPLKAPPFGTGYRLEGVEYVCDNGTDARGGSGVIWPLPNVKGRTDPFVIAIESRAESGTWSQPDADYSIFVDITYMDGTHSYGLNAPFEMDPALGWQRKELLVLPDKAISYATAYAMFRWQSGRVRFRNARLRFDSSSTASTFDTLTVDRSRFALPKLPAFLLRDVTENAPFAVIRPNVETAGVLLQTRTVETNAASFFEVRMRDGTGVDRARTLVYAIPLPATGEMVWHDSPRRSEVVRGRGQRRAIDDGLSVWPFAAVTVGDKGYALGIDPTAPAIFRATLSADFRTLFLAFDLGFAPEHPTARFKFVSFPFPAKQGFRGALATYQRLFPEHSKVRLKKHGLWIPWLKIGEIKGWEDFGFAVKEGHGDGAWDIAHGIVPFRYTEPTTWWMSMGNGAQASFDECVAEANRRADAGNKMAEAWRISAKHDEKGRLFGYVKDTPWCKGALWMMCPLPGLAGGEYEFKVGGDLPDNCLGEYIDSAEWGKARVLDYRRSHFAAARTPLGFDPRSNRVGIPQALSTYEYVSALADRCHAAGRYLMGNGIPLSWPWLVPYSDFGGQETKWIDSNGKWMPMDDQALIYRRAMSGAKPYCFLQNVAFEKFTRVHAEKYFHRCLAYGFFPGFFSPNAADGHYFSRPEIYERDRDLFKKFIPILRGISEAGWRPVNTLAAASNPALYVEQFGRRALTVYNPTPKEQTFTLSLQQKAVEAKELVTGEEWRIQLTPKELTIPSEETRVIVFRGGF